MASASDNIQGIEYLFREMKLCKCPCRRCAQKDMAKYDWKNLPAGIPEYRKNWGVSNNSTYAAESDNAPLQARHSRSSLPSRTGARFSDSSASNT